MKNVNPEFLRPESIGKYKKFHEPAMKQKTREINIILIPNVQAYHKAKNIQKPYDTQNLSTL